MSGWRKRTIMEMAKQVGYPIQHEEWRKATEEFAALVREDEREACAKVCEAEADDGTEGEWDGCCLFLANQIRERGNT